MDLVRRALLSGRFRPVTSAVPVEGWFEVRGGFRFGYPWPWRSAEAADIVDSAGTRSSDDVLGTLAAPRVNGVARLIVWADRSDFDTIWPKVELGLERLYGSVPRELRYVRLGDQRSVVGDVVVDGQLVSRLIAESPRGHVVHAELSVPRSAGAGYRPHFDTMLASWEWA